MSKREPLVVGWTREPDQFAVVGKTTEQAQSVFQKNCVSLGKMDLNVHPLVQDTDDFNVLAGLGVEDHRPPRMILAVSLADIVTGVAPLLGIGGPLRLAGATWVRKYRSAKAIKLVCPSRSAWCVAVLWPLYNVGPALS
jgi:hypothetical protein